MAAKQPYDRSGQWLLQHHGAAVLKLSGVSGIRSCRAVQAEVVQARQIPDGLLEVEFDPKAGELGEPIEQASGLYVVEIATYPQSRVPGQMMRDGMVPWVPLSRIDGPPEPVLRRCPHRIEAEAHPGEKENLLAVTQVLASLRYNDPSIMQLFGGRQTMIESPVIQELVEEVEQKAKQDDILLFLETRFDSVPQDVGDAVKQIADEASLRSLIQLAARCLDIEAFRRGLPAADPGAAEKQ